MTKFTLFARFDTEAESSREAQATITELFHGGDPLTSWTFIDPPPVPTDDTYSGWTNRETWCVHLWLTNEAELYAGALAAAKAVNTFAPENVENYTRNALDETEAGAATGWTLDLINCALARVNWGEIATALREG